MKVNELRNAERADAGDRALDAYARGAPINEETVTDCIADIMHCYNASLKPGPGLVPDDAFALVERAMRHYITEAFKGED